MRPNRLAPFILWLLLFYSVWLAIVATGNYWNEVASHWGIALSMLFGSYIAGSTPMGGGTVGFPILVLLFDSPGALGRNFGLSIQSIGMVSASVYIFCVGRPLEGKLLKFTILGSLIGTPVGAIFIAPVLSDLTVKLTFAVVWASFGLMHLAKMRELVQHEGINDKWFRWDSRIGLTIGLIGGVVASVTGVGIDMIVYAVLVLLYRADLKIAIPTSVVLMAVTSVIGISTNLILNRIDQVTYPLGNELFFSWLAAAPVVALGAPLGSFVVSFMPRSPTLIIVSLLCLTQFVWTAVHERLSLPALAIAIVAIGCTNVAFMMLHRLGEPHEAGRAC